MAFKMKNPSVAKMVKMAGNNRTAMKMKAEEAAAMKMKKAAMKLKEEAAMKMKKEAAMKLKKESAMKAAKPDFPDIDGDGNTSESMKKAAADKKSGMKMKKDSSMKMGHKSPAKLKKESPAKMGHKSPKKMKKDDSSMKMGHSPKKMKKSAMKLSEADKEKAMENAMPAAEVERLSDTTMAGMKKYFGGINADYDGVRTKLLKARKSGDSNYQEMRKIAKARYPNLTRML